MWALFKQILNHIIRSNNLTITDTKTPSSPWSGWERVSKTQRSCPPPALPENLFPATFFSFIHISTPVPSAVRSTASSQSARDSFIISWRRELLGMRPGFAASTRRTGLPARPESRVLNWTWNISEAQTHLLKGGFCFMWGKKGITSSSPAYQRLILWECPIVSQPCVVFGSVEVRMIIHPKAWGRPYTLPFMTT